MIPTRTEISIELVDPRQEYNDFIWMVLRTHPTPIIAHTYAETLKELRELSLEPVEMDYLKTLVRYYKAHWKRYASDSPDKWDGWEAERKEHWYGIHEFRALIPRGYMRIQRWIDIYVDLTHDPNATATSPVRL